MKRDMDILGDDGSMLLEGLNHLHEKPRPEPDPLPAKEENAVLSKVAACVAEFNCSFAALEQILDKMHPKSGYSSKYSPRACLLEMRNAMYTVAEEAYRQQMKRIEAEGNDGDEPDNYLIMYFLKEIGEI